MEQRALKTIVLLGAGKIGRMVTHFLAGTGEYAVRVGDVAQAAVDALKERHSGVSGSRVDFSEADDLDALFDGADAVISCAPFHCNPLIAERAREKGLHYFDLTEDVAVTDQVEKLADGAETAFVPQCGLAPGFITIAANHLIEPMTEIREVRMRVGALPRYPSNRLKYNLTWSTEGLINEYLNPCEVLLDGEFRSVQALENLERLTIDGVEYEAFNTSGGLGSFAHSLQGRVRNVNYKSIRYPGHNALIKFLMDDLRMGEQPGVLKDIFERCLPATMQDQIVIFVSAVGEYLGRLTERTYAKTIYHQEIDGENWSGIQVTTSAGVCALVDLLFEGKLPGKGFIKQEQVPWTDFITNRFGRYYA
ncbi:MAG: saccharopine dehydrogenase C-terminal domain-containing protein [Planctomycetota bacterium]